MREISEVDTLRGLQERLRREGRFAWRIDVMPPGAKFRYRVTILPLPCSARQFLDVDDADMPAVRQKLKAEGRAILSAQATGNRWRIEVG